MIQRACTYDGGPTSTSSINPFSIPVTNTLRIVFLDLFVVTESVVWTTPPHPPAHTWSMSEKEGLRTRSLGDSMLPPDLRLAGDLNQRGTGQLYLAG